MDLGCGIGKITSLLSHGIGNQGNVTGVDYSEELIKFANQNYKKENIEFLLGDINKLDFPSESFDWIWSMDTIWAGPKQFGCPVKEPDHAINQLYKFLKPGGVIYLLYWTSQKLIPGYPLLEANLNSSISGVLFGPQ